MTQQQRTAPGPRTGKLSKRERALHAAHGPDKGYGSRHDFDKGFRAGWRAREAEAAEQSVALDVEALRRILPQALADAEPSMSDSADWEGSEYVDRLSDAIARLVPARPADTALREALEQIVNLYTDNRTYPASFAIQAGEIALAALAASPDPEGPEARP